MLEVAPLDMVRLELENAESLRRQIKELDEQIQGFNLVAERAGYVLNPDLAELEGGFVDRGDELCQVINPSQKELLASVGESDLIAYRKAANSGTPVAVRLKGGTSFSVTLHGASVACQTELTPPHAGCYCKRTATR